VPDICLTADTLMLTPDPTLLATADQFPLVVDPPFTGGTREKWAVVYSATPKGCPATLRRAVE
jgi:hypothetical protein